MGGLNKKAFDALLDALAAVKKSGVVENRVPPDARRRLRESLLDEGDLFIPPVFGGGANNRRKSLVSYAIHEFPMSNSMRIDMEKSLGLMGHIGPRDPFTTRAEALAHPGALWRGAFEDSVIPTSGIHMGTPEAAIELVSTRLPDPYASYVEDIPRLVEFVPRFISKKSVYPTVSTDLEANIIAKILRGEPIGQAGDLVPTSKSSYRLKRPYAVFPYVNAGEDLGSLSFVARNLDVAPDWRTVIAKRLYGMG